MEDKHRTDTSKYVKNPLLSVAGGGFPLDSLSGSTLLVPVSENCPSVLPDDVVEEDHFLGQDAAPPPVQSASAFDVDVQGSFDNSFDNQPLQEQTVRPDPAASALAGLSSSFNALTASLPSAFSFFSGAAQEPPPAESTPPPPVFQPPLLPPPPEIDVDNAPGLETVPLGSSSSPTPVFFNPATFQSNTVSSARSSVAHPSSSIYAQSVSLPPPSNGPAPVAPPATTHWGIQPIVSDPPPVRHPPTTTAFQSIGPFFTGQSHQQPPPQNPQSTWHYPGKAPTPVGSAPASTPPLSRDNYRNSPTPTGNPAPGPPFTVPLPTGPPAGPSAGGPKAYSLGGHRRPAYAPVPGLLLSSATQPMASGIASGLAPAAPSAQLETAPPYSYASPSAGPPGGPPAFAPPPARAHPTFGSPPRQGGSPSLPAAPSLFGVPHSTPPPLSAFAPHPSSVAPPPSAIAPLSSLVAPSPSSVAPPQYSVAPPSSLIGLPPTSIAPPPSSIAPPPSLVAPPPSSVAPSLSSVDPPSSSIGLPPSSVAPLQSFFSTSPFPTPQPSCGTPISASAQPPTSIVPPPSSVAPLTSSITSAPSSIAPPPVSLAPPPTSVAPQPSSIAPPPTSVASQTSSIAPPQSSIAPPLASFVPPPTSVAQPFSSIAPPSPTVPHASVIPAHSSAASYFTAASNQPQAAQPFPLKSWPSAEPAPTVFDQPQVPAGNSSTTPPILTSSDFFTSSEPRPPSTTNAAGSSALQNKDPSSLIFEEGTSTETPNGGASSQVVSPTQESSAWILDPSQFSGVPRNVDPARQNLTEMAPGQNGSAELDCTQYKPVYFHWFYKQETPRKVQWKPFSMKDSTALEAAFQTQNLSSETVVATDGGRYDVNLVSRTRTAVYWDEAVGQVRRCSWFYKGDSSLVPYEESVAARLEAEYMTALTTGEWQRRVKFSEDEMIIFYSPHALYHCMTTSSSDAWGNVPHSPTRSRAVKRGLEDFVIPEGEPDTIDHLLFLVQGIGSACDLKFRGLVEVVDDFRSMALQLIDSHFSEAVRSNKAHRVEVLPISWHAKLHGDETGIDQRLGNITLPSVPKVRHLANDAIADVLFYTSPVYCQTIVETVGSELNRLHDLFLKRNPKFKGGVSVSGHSLGSLILFDLLCHQKAPKSKLSRKPEARHSSSEASSINVVEDKEVDTFSDDQSEESHPTSSSKKKGLTRRISYVMLGPLGTGQPYISYPQLNFHPRNFFAYGSPIGIFVTVRGIELLGEDFVLPTCPSFFNIFHPCDLVAYRIESLIRPDMVNVRPVLIPHHKGRKRMHLELKETMARMGADIKQRVLDSVYNTWNTVCQLSVFHRNDEQLRQDMNQVIEDEMWELGKNNNSSSALTEKDADPNIKVGKLNGGRRVDYVLQETPLESFNEYFSAIYSHVCYWTSEDTTLLTLKEIFASAGVPADKQLPQEHVIPPLGSVRSSPSPPTVGSISAKSSKAASRSSP